MNLEEKIEKLNQKFAKVWFKDLGWPKIEGELRGIWTTITGKKKARIPNSKTGHCQRCGKESKRLRAWVGFWEPAIFGEFEVCPKCQRSLEGDQLKNWRLTDYFFEKSIERIRLLTSQVCAEYQAEFTRLTFNERLNLTKRAVYSAIDELIFDGKAAVFNLYPSKRRSSADD